MSLSILRQIEVSGYAGGARDAVGNQRTVAPKRLIDERAVAAGPLTGNLASGGGSFAKDVNKSSFLLSTGGAIGGTAARQSRTRAVYHAGQSHDVKMTFTLGTLTAGIRQRVGYFDASNGLFLELDGTSPAFVLRSSVTGSPVDTKYLRAEWQDKLDGTGPSGITIDWTKSQLLRIDFLWQGVGSVRFGFMFDGTFVVAHTLVWGNNQPGVFMTIPNQPVRWEITDVSANANVTLEATCAEVATEGFGDPAAIPLAYDTDGTPETIASGNYGELVAVRLDSVGSLIASAKAEYISCLNATGGNFLWEVWLNGGGTTGGTWSTPSASYCEYSVDRTMPTGGYTSGVKVASGYVSSSANENLASLFPELLAIGYDINAGAAEVISLAVRNLAATPDDFYGSIVLRNEA